MRSSVISAGLIPFVIGVLGGGPLNACIRRILQGEKFMLSPFTGLANGLLYLLVAWNTGFTWTGLLFCICASVLLVIGVVDGKTLEIPVGCNILIGILGCVRLAFDLTRWYQYLAGFLAAGALLLAAFKLSKGRGIGGGDIKLTASAGLLLGWENILLALFIGSLSGLAVHTALMRFKGRGRVMAFGPYLAFGIFAAMLCGD